MPLDFKVERRSEEERVLTSSTVVTNPCREREGREREGEREREGVEERGREREGEEERERRVKWRGRR